MTPTAPAFGAAGTYLTGQVRTTSNIPMPAGVVAGVVVSVHLYIETASTVTPTTGFTEVTPVSSTTGTVITHRVWTKRATGTESGVWGFTHASAYTEGVAVRWSGTKTAGAIVDVSNNAVRSSAATGTPAVSATTTAAATRLVWSAGSVGQGAWTSPTSFTEHVDPSLSLTVASLAQAAAGATGSLTGVGPSGFMGAWVVALLPAEQGDVTSATTTSTTAAARLAGVATSTTTTSTTAAATVSAPPPLAAYSFDSTSGSILDDSGNGHSWSLGGSAIRSVSGHTGGGLATNGGGSTATLASPAFGQSSNRTLMMWMINPANTTQWVVRWNVNSLGSGSWGFLLLGTEVSVQARNASTFERATCTRPTDGLWHHYAAVYESASNSLRFYLDGVLTQNNTALTAPLRTDADTVDIGEWTDTATVIDDLRIYDTALTAGQISTLSGQPVTPAGAVTSTTTTSTTAVARLAGTATSPTTTSTTAVARAAGTATSATTTATTAAARLAGRVISTTTTTTTAAARIGGVVIASTTTTTVAAAIDSSIAVPPGPFTAGAPVLAGTWRHGSPTLAPGWRGAGPALAPGWRAGTAVAT